MSEVEWYEQDDIEAIDNLIEKIDAEHHIKLFDSYLDTFSGIDREEWKDDAKRWAQFIIDELNGFIEAVDELE